MTTPKDIKFEEESRAKLAKGVEILAKSVKVTLGPKGKNVLIESPSGGVPKVTKDGVSVAKEIYLRDKFENLGAQMIKEASKRTADVAGDGTTTATVLAEAIFQEGIKLVSAGHNAMALKRGIDEGVSAIKKEIDRLSVHTSDINDIARVGTISANGDSTIGNYIASALEKVGQNGVITIGEANGIDTELEIVEGMQFDRGYVAPHFSTNTEKLFSDLENPFILLTTEKIMSVQELLPAMELASKNSKPLVVIAESIEGEALAVMITNHMRGALRCCAVKAPSFGDKRKSILSDIAVLTGGVVMSAENGKKLEHIKVSDFGSANKVKTTQTTCTIIDGKGKYDDLQSRIEQIKNQIEETRNEYEVDFMKERVAKLCGGVAVIRIGAATEAELREKKDRIDDALAATRAAIEEGIVAGGGVTLLRASKVLDDLELEDGKQFGLVILKNAVKEPIKQIAINCGVEGSVIIKEILSSDNTNYGYNFATDKYGDMIEMGVIDPAKVVKTALQNAASVAGLLLTTGCSMVAEQDEKRDTANPRA